MAKKQKNKRVVSEKSEVAKKYNIRISTPNGYYPEDVDKVIRELEKVNVSQAKEIEALAKRAERAVDDLSKLQAEFAQFKINVSSMDLHESSYETDIQNIAKIEQIAGIEEDKQTNTVEINKSVGDLEMVDLLDIAPKPTPAPAPSSVNKSSDDLEILSL